MNGVEWAPPPGTYRRFNDESMLEMEKDNEKSIAKTNNAMGIF